MKNDEQQILNIIKYAPPLFLLLISILITIIISYDYKKTLNEEKTTIQKIFIKDQKEMIRRDVSSAINFIQREDNTTEEKLKIKLERELKNVKVMITSIYKNNKNSKSKDEITKIIKDTLQKIRFNNGRGYFFINQRNGINVFHPIFPKREGTNLNNQKDSRGIIRFQKIKKIIDENKKGFTSFYFFNPKDKTKQQNKLTYVEYFEPYDWIIGTGEYIKEFEKEIQEMVLNNLNDFDLGKNKYYGVISYDGTFLSHPKNDLLNHNIFKDEKLHRLKPLFRKIKNLMKDGEGYYEFIQSRKPDTGEPAQKIAFMKTFPKWNWIIYTGFYPQDIEKTIDEKKTYLDDKYNKYKNTVIISSIIITIILLLLSVYLSKIIETNFIRYRKKLEKEMAENIQQKVKLEEAQKIGKIGDWELDFKTKKGFWSEQTIKLFGIDKLLYEPGPEYLKKIMLSEDWHYFEDSINKARDGKTKHKCQYRVKGDDNKIRWIECIGDYNKEKQTMIGIVQDITENKNLELEKTRKEEILYQQSKMAAMGEMIGNIAHQWRQPLSAISTLATGSKIQKEMNILSDKEFDKAMDAINDTAQYLSQTINDFRNFYKPNSNETKFYISSILEKSLKLISSQFKTKNIKIIKNIEEIEIKSLENELLQVLINIFNNAKDAFENQEIDNKFILINIFTNKKDSNKINIEIIDNANGIKEDIIHRIFEPYFTTKYKSQGTGIGLYMCEEILKKHLDGEIIAENITFNYDHKEYYGAKFTIVLYKNID